MRAWLRADRSTFLTVLGLIAVLMVAVLAATAGWFAMVGRDAGLPPGRAARRPAVTSPAGASAVVPVPGRTGTAGCIDPAAGQEWRVTWQAVTGWNPPPQVTGANPASTAGPAATTGFAGTGAGVADPVTELLPTGFAVRTLTATGTSSATALASEPASAATAEAGGSTQEEDDGGWRSEDAARWRVRWTPTPAERLAAAPGETFQRDGALLDLAGLTLPVNDSPRYLTPDGACTVYLAPFVSAPSATGSRTPAGAGGPDGDPVAVVGDDLLAQLTPGAGDPAQDDDLLQRRLWQAGRRSEIAAVPDGRWSIAPQSQGSPAAPADPDRADATMLDELRGLRRPGTATVIALGTGDAEWAASSSGPAFQQRSASVMIQLEALLEEVSAGGQCTVLVTVAHRGDYRITSTVGRFNTVAGRINALLRRRANDHPNDHLKLADWAILAGRHRSNAGRPWFDPGVSVDTGTGRISPHQRLNADGRQEYATALTQAVTLC